MTYAEFFQKATGHAPYAYQCRLAYFEALFRAADVRASILAKRKS